MATDTHHPYPNFIDRVRDVIKPTFIRPRHRRFDLTNKLNILKKCYKNNKNDTDKCQSELNDFTKSLQIDYHKQYDVFPATFTYS